MIGHFSKVCSHDTHSELSIIFWQSNIVLVSSTETKGELSEWQKLDKIASHTSNLKENITKKSNPEESGIISEYEKFCSTIYSEYAKQTEIFLVLQKSNYDILSNCFRVSFNFLNLGIDMNQKFTNAFVK